MGLFFHKKVQVGNACPKCDMEFINAENYETYFKSSSIKKEI